MGFPLSPHSIRAAKWVTLRVPSEPFYAVVSDPSFPKLRCMIGGMSDSSSAIIESMASPPAHGMVTCRRFPSSFCLHELVTSGVYRVHFSLHGCPTAPDGWSRYYRLVSCTCLHKGLTLQLCHTIKSKYPSVFLKWVWTQVVVFKFY